MRPKTIVWIIAIIALVVLAAAPLGQIFVDLGNALVGFGHALENFSVVKATNG